MFSGKNGKNLGIGFRRSTFGDRIRDYLDQLKTQDAINFAYKVGYEIDNTIIYIKSYYFNRGQYSEAINVCLLANSNLKIRMLKRLYSVFVKKVWIDYALQAANYLPNSYRVCYLRKIIRYCKDPFCTLDNNHRKKILSEAQGYLGKVKDTDIDPPQTKKTQIII